MRESTSTSSVPSLMLSVMLAVSYLMDFVSCGNAGAGTVGPRWIGSDISKEML